MTDATKTTLGPITWDMYVHVQDASGAHRGMVTVGISPGKVPTEEEIIKAIGAALNALPDGYCLMEPDNFISLLIEEKTGQRGPWAAPETMRYDADALIDRALKAAEVKENDE
jgi:hypothetical protein